jgi:hypothetical protein
MFRVLRENDGETIREKVTVEMVQTVLMR